MGFFNISYQLCCGLGRGEGLLPLRLPRLAMGHFTKRNVEMYFYMFFITFPDSIRKSAAVLEVKVKSITLLLPIRQRKEKNSLKKVFIECIFYI